jgi:glycosyltransferase involved in cell wall biosynthesis
LSNNTQLTIIVPIFNEEENIERLKESLSHYFQKASVPVKALFVDDGSTDGSLDKIKSICENSHCFDYISFTQNQGLSAAIKAGFDHVDSSLTGYIDADLQTDPDDFELLLEHIGDYDLVTGNRNHGRKDSFTKNMSSKIANGIRRTFTHDGMEDTGCPLKIIKTEYAKRIPMFKGLHRFLPAMIMLQNGKVKQVDIQNYPRLAGQSKFGLWNRLLGPLLDCFVYLWMKKKYINYEIEEKS